MIDFIKLKAEALASPLLRSRSILVPGYDMVICLHKESRVGLHRHPKYEAYHVLEGRLGVKLDNEYNVFNKTQPIVVIPAGVWHEPKAETKFVIYREFYCGPFEKSRDVEYA